MKFKLFEPHIPSVSGIFYVSKYHRILVVCGDLAAFLGLSMIFYNSLIPGILFSPLIIFLYNYQYRQMTEKRKNQLEYQFKDLLTSLNAAIATGYSLENATKEAYLEMSSMYGEKSTICKEISIILNHLHLGKSVEYAYEQFAKRCDSDYILTFSEVLTIAKRSSGNISSVIKQTSSTILLKIDSDREIKQTLSSKLFERNIMIFMPILILAYVGISSPGFFDPLYSTLVGRLIMTCCLAIYLFAIWLSSRIFRLEAL